MSIFQVAVPLVFTSGKERSKLAYWVHPGKPKRAAQIAGQDPTGALLGHEEPAVVGEGNSDGQVEPGDQDLAREAGGKLLPAHPKRQEKNQNRRETRMHHQFGPYPWSSHRSYSGGEYGLCHDFSVNPASPGPVFDGDVERSDNPQPSSRKTARPEPPLSQRHPCRRSRRTCPGPHHRSAAKHSRAMAVP